MEAVTYRKVAAGTILTREGNRGDSLFYIIAGRIEIQKESVDGKHTVMARFNKGASVGEMSLVEDSPRSATAIALDDVELLIITKKDFDALIEDHPLIGLTIVRNIARALSTRLRYTSGRFADMIR